MTPDERAKGCEGCRYLLRQDEGYSNYTVTNSTVHCLKGVNPAMPISDDVESAAFDGALAFGETCPAKSPGDGPWYDVDGEVTEEDYKDDPEIYALLKVHGAPPSGTGETPEPTNG